MEQRPPPYGSRPNGHPEQKSTTARKTSSHVTPDSVLEPRGGFARKSANRNEPPGRAPPPAMIQAQNAPPMNRTWGVVSKNTGGAHNKQAGKQAANPQRQPQHAHERRRFTIRKQATVAPREEGARFAYVAPAQPYPRRASKNSDRRLSEVFIDNDDHDGAGVGRKLRAQDARAARISGTMVAAGRRNAGAARKTKSVLSNTRHGAAIFTGRAALWAPGLVFHEKVGGQEVDEREDMNVIANAPRSIAKAARKSQPPANTGLDNMDAQRARKTTEKKATRESRAVGLYELDDPYGSPDADVDNSSSDSSEDDNHDAGDNVEGLMNALERLTLPTERMREYGRLPFLPRNVRRGFLRRCRQYGIETAPSAPPAAPVHVLYRYDVDARDNDTVTSGDAVSDDEHSYEEREGYNETLEWTCPLCRLHKTFDTREMLAFHLSRSHDEFKVIWEPIEVDDERTWKITLLVPHPDQDDSSDEEDEDEDEDEDETFIKREPTQERIPSATPRPIRTLGLPGATQQQNLLRTPSPPLQPIAQPSVEPYPTPVSLPLSEPIANEPRPALVKSKFRAPSPALSSTETHQASSRSSTAQVERHILRGSLPARYPTPPLPADPQGPAAQPPYMPHPSEGKHYSCRPGGPRIYDLLNELPLEPFGVMAWYIVDREEAIFEQDMRDEDKVMLALWDRWIMLERISFVKKGYCKGVKKFIDQYWRMIHRAAGWRALRGFLITLAQHRFLTVPEVVDILKYYEQHTGMDYWYKD
ncbi:hypothetical protein WOLCODRAFT_165362 [Wolfiporia cocos MD-104 SS10]|uniref:Uncharacterized protein n=1 Tax=Wolfiporia cocos (strain MD-104) TaxID=742152 RepID=A0A2H3K8E6_WOLCO|nr:hypothetical protein WOLCODRAFT_165362 [Wolfiporia cocos MD-104 SS10]